MSEPGSILRIKRFSDSEEEQHDQDEAEQSEEEMEIEAKKNQNKKPGKKGIIYIGSIPKQMNVAICRELMEHFGEVGRIFLQPDKKGSK